MTYKLIQECGLKVIDKNTANYNEQFVYAKDLEAFLASGYRSEKQFVLEIPKLEPVTKEEIVQFIKNYSHSKNSSAVEFVERIEKAGIR